MYMTIQQILREKNLSRYQLSKKSGVPWATLADICSGKTTLSRCSAGTLMKLSSTLDIPMEQLITLTVEKPQMHGGKPTDQTYLEKNLPASLDKALREYIQGEKDKVSYMDCLWGELYSAINSNQWSNAITQEQAEHHPQKNIITRALGVDYRLDPEFTSVPVQKGDMLLLCTDGLTNVLPKEKIEEIFTKGGFYDIPDRLVDAANAGGGPDNITALLLGVEPLEVKHG